MSPEIHKALEMFRDYVFVGLNQCRTTDRFWVTLLIIYSPVKVHNSINCGGC